ncbi:MAG TPA: hypothetical protein V6C99_06185 [Oculatellaceae cyanobacterium]|jgi:hypothetical protein
MELGSLLSFGEKGLNGPESKTTPVGLAAGAKSMEGVGATPADTAVIGGQEKQVGQAPCDCSGQCQSPTQHAPLKQGAASPGKQITSPAGDTLALSNLAPTNSDGAANEGTTSDSDWESQLKALTSQPV